jgi:tetratricopeptide (TPR) repeat protein
MRAFLSTYLPALGLELCKLGRHREAEPLAATGRELADEADVSSQVLWRVVLAHVRSAEGDHVEAERLAREAVTIVDGTDSLTGHGDTRADLAEVLAAAGRTAEALEQFAEALERFERKKNLARAEQVRTRLEALRAGDRA